MFGYIVFLCPKCGTARYARISQKTAKCLRCGQIIQMKNHRTRILYKTRNVAEAKEIVQKIKEKLKFRGHL